MKSLFSTHAVAFLDILGFHEILAEAEEKHHPTKLDSIITVIESHIRFGGENKNGIYPEYEKSIPDYLFISDSIIISEKVTNELNYNALFNVTLKSIQIFHKLLEMGVLLRGGISIGNVMKGRDNIFGSGYIQAYNAQENDAKHPRIILTSSAVEHLHNFFIDRDDIDQNDFFLRDDKGITFVDVLHPSCIRGSISLKVVKNLLSSIIKPILIQPLHT